MFLSIDNQRSQAVRMDPFFSDTNYKVYWTVKCYGDKSILLCQCWFKHMTIYTIFGNCLLNDLYAYSICRCRIVCTAASDEKWSAFEAE